MIEALEKLAKLLGKVKRRERGALLLAMARAGKPTIPIRARGSA